jgi:ParB/RepB/Spo0J family partition protein
LEQYKAYSIPVTAIYYDAAFNCRGEFTLQSVKELADSIAQAGRLICPVAVQPWSETEGFAYRLIVGHRRFKAVTTFLKWTAIPAYICDGLSDHEARMLNLLENLQRKSLNILEEARAIQNLFPQGAPLRQAAEELKQPTKWVHIRVRLLRMPEAIQQKAAAGLLSQVNLEMLAGIEKADEQIKAAEEIVEARQRGRGKFLPGLDRTYKRRRGVRPRKEINQMIERMLAAGVGGLPPRVAAWCAGQIPDEELLKEIETATRKGAEDYAVSGREGFDGHADRPG